MSDAGDGSSGTERDELTVDDLAHEGSPYSWQDIPVGKEVWIPASMIYPTGCRAVKVKVLDRASIGTYEEDNAIDEWDTNTETN